MDASKPTGSFEESLSGLLDALRNIRSAYFPGKTKTNVKHAFDGLVKAALSIGKCLDDAPEENTEISDWIRSIQKKVQTWKRAIKSEADLLPGAASGVHEDVCTIAPEELKAREWLKSDGKTGRYANSPEPTSSEEIAEILRKQDSWGGLSDEDSTDLKLHFLSQGSPNSFKKFCRADDPQKLAEWLLNCPGYDVELNQTEYDILTVYVESDQSYLRHTEEEQNKLHSILGRNKLRFSRKKEALATEKEAGKKKTKSANGKPTSQPALEAPSKARGGWMGAKDLAAELGVHPLMAPAFSEKLRRMREKHELSLDDWQESENRKRNEPQFLYRTDSPVIVAMAQRYLSPK